VLEKWKCEFAREKREMHNFLENHLILINPPLDPHVLWWPENIETNIVMGENTLCGRVFSVSVRNENGYFSVRPTIYIGEECSELIGVTPNFNFEFVEGIIRCTVLPPRDLFHPILLYHIQGKLFDCVIVAAKRSRRLSAFALSPPIVNS